MADAKPTVVAKGSRVSVEYTGSFDDGTVFDSTQNKDPITFTAGNGEVIRGFDEAVVGMKKGEQKKIKVSPKDGYGDRDEKLQQQVPRTVFPQEMKLEKGMGFSFRAPQGQMIHATITDVSNGIVTLDMNHPLAGKNLVFELKVVDLS